MSKKIDRMLENDFNKSYRPNVFPDQIMASLHTEDIKVMFKPKFVWFKHLAKAFSIIIIMALVFVGCLSVKKYSTEKINLAQSICNVQVVDKSFVGLNEVELDTLHRTYSGFNDIPLLVIYHFDDIRIYIYWAKQEQQNNPKVYYFCLVEYAKNNTDETSVLVDGEVVLRATQRTFMLISSKNLESSDSNDQFEFEVNYRGESRKLIAKKK